jgi:hypothetical protein
MTLLSGESEDSGLKYLKKMSPLTTAIVVVWALQAAVRIGMAIVAAKQNTLVGDQHGYWILGTHFFNYLLDGNCTRLPLYPLFLSVIISVVRFFGASQQGQALVVFLVQHGLMMGTIHLVSKLVVFSTGRPRSYLVGLVILSCYFPLLLYPNGLLTETLFIFLMAGACFFLFRALMDDDGDSPRRQLYRFGTAGLLLACAGLTRPNVLLFPFILAPILWLRRRALLKPLAVFLLLYCTLLTPWLLRNYVIYHQFAYCSISGRHLYLANQYETPFTYAGMAIEKRYGRVPPRAVEEKGLGRMRNNLASFLDREDVRRNREYQHQALSNIRWHADYELAAFLKHKLPSLWPALFQGATVEYHYADLRYSSVPNAINNVYHIALVIIAILYLIKVRGRVRVSETFFLVHVVYTFSLCLMVVMFPRVLLPTMVFFIYFAVVLVDEKIGDIELFRL